MTTKRNSLKALASASLIAFGLVGALGTTAVQAQTKLKWAHVYETSEAYHTESVWAADEIKKINFVFLNAVMREGLVKRLFQ
jgi:TRAP-type C4-dicarboxylate transport system substrate-binding protein